MLNCRHSRRLLASRFQAAKQSGRELVAKEFGRSEGYQSGYQRGYSDATRELTQVLEAPEGSCTIGEQPKLPIVRVAVQRSPFEAGIVTLEAVQMCFAVESLKQSVIYGRYERGVTQIVWWTWKMQGYQPVTLATTFGGKLRGCAESG